MMEGLPSIRGFWQSAVENLDDGSSKLISVVAEMSGDTVVEIGVATLTLANGQTVELKYVVLSSPDGGFWNWYTDIQNMN